MKNFFKPEDFDPSIGVANDGQSLCTYEWAAKKANEKLNALIESYPVFYGTKDNNGQHFHENPKGNYNPTHKARLAFIEEIVKEPCKHEPKRNYHHAQELAPTPICYHCGVDLQATWSEKK